MTWTITKTILAVCLGLGCVLQLAAANLLADANIEWGVRLLDQGMGSIERNSNGSGYSINKDSEVGAVCLAAEKQIPLESGKSYELAVKLKTGGSAKASIMLSIAIDGGKRRYLQTVPISTGDKFSLQKKSFVAQKGETEAAIVIVVAGGVGVVEVEAVDFQETTQGSAVRAESAKDAVKAEPAKASTQDAISKLPEPVRAEICFKEGRPRLKVDGKLIFEEFFITVPRPGQIALEVVPDVIKAGYQVILIPVYTDRDGIWKADNKYDWKPLDKRLKVVQSMGPDVKVMLYLCLNTPTSWMKAHPQERVVYDNESPGEIKPGGELSFRSILSPSYASEVFAKSMESFLKALIEHVDTQPYRNTLIGYHVAGGYDGQWYHYGLNMDKLPDYSEHMRQYFIRYLRKKYGDDVKRLQAAWHNPQIDFDAATIPTRKQRFEGGVFHDPATQQNVLDYMEAHAQAPVDLIKRLAGVVKSASDRRALFSVYGGGIIMDTGKTTQACGRIVLKELLECPDVDAIANVTYYQRPLYEPGGLGSVMTSYRLHQKLAIHEQDIRTYLTKTDICRKEPLWGFTPDWEQQKNMLIREFGWVLGSGGATWQYDMEGGWYSAPEFWKLFSQFHKIGEEQYKHPYKSAAQMAVVVDDISMIYPQDNDLLMYNAVSVQRTPLGWMGAPYDVYLMSDLLRGDVPKYKCYFFLNCYRVDSPMRTYLHKLLREAKATAIWLYAPGIVSDGTLSEDNVEKLTGFSVKRVDDLGSETEVVIRKGDHPVTRELGGTRFGTPMAIGSKLPSFSGNSFYLPQKKEGVTILGDIETTGQPGLAIRSMDGWTSIYSSALVMTPQLLRNILASSGGFLYVNDASTGICATDRILSIYAKNDGKRQVKLPKSAVLKDLFTGEQLDAGTEFQIPLKEHEARLFSIIPKE